MPRPLRHPARAQVSYYDRERGSWVTVPGLATHTLCSKCRKPFNTRTAKSRDDWETPPWLLEKVREIFGRPIALDPCTNPDNPTGAASFYTKKENGLLLPWEPFTFVNPPYGRELPTWVDKVIEEYRGSPNRAFVVPMLVLAPCRPEVRWYNRLSYFATNRCIFDQRIQFVNPETKQVVKGSNFPNALFLFDAPLFLERSSFEVRFCQVLASVAAEFKRVCG